MPFCFSENRNKKTKNPVTIFKCSQHSYATVRQNGVERTGTAFNISFRLGPQHLQCLPIQPPYSRN